jgi:hypothetical protein
MKRAGVTIARPRVDLGAIRFTTGLSMTSIFQLTSFYLPNVAFVELIEALEASLLALSTIVFAFVPPE